MSWSSLRSALVAAALATPAWAEFPNCRNGTLATNQVCNTTLDPWSRAKALVAEFTVDEKIKNTQDKSPGVPRIGLPPYEWWNEALHGVAWSPGISFGAAGQQFNCATSFPQPITMGAAFDMPLIRAVAETISTEARAFSNAGRGGLNFWTPNINPFRDPRWGRGQEVPSEDPYFISQYVNQLIPGLQGGLRADPFFKLVATCKHYAGYDIEDWGGNARYGYDAVISLQDLRDYYLPPFQACARDANAQSFMCSYNAVNGVPTCADPWLLEDLLRDHWNWTESNQWVTSDCDALKNVYSAHHFRNMSAPAAAAASLNAGTDLDCGSFWPDNLGAAYNGSLFNESTLDVSLIRRYASLVRLGYFDPPEKQPYRQLGWADVATKDAQTLARKAAIEGLVLLKNNGVLPLEKPGGAIKTVAVLGPMAAASRQMQGNYFGNPPVLISPVTAFQQGGYTVLTVSGVGVSSGTLSGVVAALDAAAKADAVVFVGGIDNTLESEEHDRTAIEWPAAQVTLIQQLAMLTAEEGKEKPFVVVQMGTVVDASQVRDSSGVDALLWAGYPGQDGGTAIVDVLLGKAAPAGRLPFTQYPAGYVDEVPMTDMGLRPSQGSGGAQWKNGTEDKNPGRTYKWYTGKPVFEFGSGLHYTNFSASITPGIVIPSKFTTSTLVSKPAAYKDLLSFASVPVTVSNTGNVTSDFVVLGFLKGEYGPKPYPLKSLVAFKRLHDIDPGTSMNATLEIQLGSIARSDEKGNLMLWPGNYSLVLDVDDKDAWNFTIAGDAAVLDVLPPPRTS